MGDGGDCQCKNMRRGIDTLIQYVQNELNAAWHDGAAFVFTNKARSRIKVLRWDKYDVWLCNREENRRVVPS
ncbi:IS66 family insertion sequence element accessory protein TnpB [Escherichia coli]|nr:IS66 family insertion sequence element accessory protein TnpB [Escherichia coli]